MIGSRIRSTNLISSSVGPCVPQNFILYDIQRGSRARSPAVFYLLSTIFVSKRKSVEQKAAAGPGRDRPLRTRFGGGSRGQPGTQLLDCSMLRIRIPAGKASVELARMFCSCDVIQGTDPSNALDRKCPVVALDGRSDANCTSTNCRPRTVRQGRSDRADPTRAE